MRKSVVFIVDDDDGMRDSMSFLLRKASIECQTFASGEQFLNTWDGLVPGCLIVDHQMPEMSGLQLVHETRGRHGMIPFLLVTGYGTVAIAVEAMKMGAITVLEKPFHHEEFIDAVQELMAMDLKRRDLEFQQHQLAQIMDSLTPREREIAELVVTGRLTKQISKLLGISTKTVEVHRSHITKKMGVESVSQLVALVMKYQAHCSIPTPHFLTYQKEMQNENS